MGVESSVQWEENGSRIISRMGVEWEYNYQGVESSVEWE